MVRDAAREMSKDKMSGQDMNDFKWRFAATMMLDQPTAAAILTTAMSESKKQTFAELLLAWRTWQAWSREEAAAKLGVSYRTLQEWEQGRRAARSPSPASARPQRTRPPRAH